MLLARGGGGGGKANFLRAQEPGVRKKTIVGSRPPNFGACKRRGGGLWVRRPKTVHTAITKNDRDFRNKNKRTTEA